MKFEKSKEYIESIFNFMNVLYKKAVKLNDNKLIQICKLIFNYLITSCSESKLLLRDLTKHEQFDMKHVYEYIEENNIQILDLNNISHADINVSNPLDIERFVLSHIYYIYANN
jgi:SepF-like predicted cell division protein (DUF552 family)